MQYHGRHYTIVQDEVYRLIALSAVANDQSILSIPH